MEAKLGMVVRSIAGHDKGRFLVITAADDDFAYLADGKERKLASPKKKRLKHVRFTNTVIDTGNLTDKGLRQFLAEYTAKTQSGLNPNI
ncbi:MAG: KOW domain-containing RNA-binding protein [Oscillospiraceae bacterium]|nr:KOW domain-containing RNA-binding protein [Oscillospiraceae bacterium]